MNMKNKNVTILDCLEQLQCIDLGKDLLNKTEGGSEFSEWVVGKYGELRGYCYYYGNRAIDLFNTKTFI